MSDAQLHVVVKGRVQGVGYRFFVCREAAALDIKGTVRNRYDGSVEVVAEGKTAALQALLESLKVGPRFGHVSALDVNWLPYSGAYHHFDVIY